ncbi:MAG: ABC transporter permease [Rhizobiaceae bacterium]
MLTDAPADASHGGTRLTTPTVVTSPVGGGVVCTLAGDWTTRTVAIVDSALRKLEAANPQGSLTVNLADVRRIDTAGAWLVERLVRARKAHGDDVVLTGESNAAATLLAAVGHAYREDRPAVEPGPGSAVAFLEFVGRSVYGLAGDLKAAMHILGAAIRGAQMKLGRSHGVSPAAIINQIDRIGVGAIPVVILMSSIVGGIIAQQGAFQLRYFGAEFFIVDLVSILALRELGVLMTAVMIAGRSGSAITAEIGSMKMREEVDALTVIGLNPIGVLVFPRLVALVIAVPCLTVIADFAALGGAMLVAWFYSGVEPQQFVDRLRVGIDLTTIFAGFIKAPFMAIIIGIIASVEGLKVGGSAESLGLHVTSSVVKSIFLVIIVDGFFAMFYAAIDF